MVEIDQNFETTARAAARGLVAAMAMTGTRVVSTSAGLIEETPPGAIVGQQAHGLVSGLSDDQRALVTELAHWAYGAVGGAAFGLLAPTLRGHPWAGPVYGLAVWLAFELGLAPLLGVEYERGRAIVPRAVIALDHVLYGVVVAGRLAPEPTVAHPGWFPRWARKLLARA